MKKYDLEPIEPIMAYDPMVEYVARPSPLRLVHRSRKGISRPELNKFAKKIGRSITELAGILPSSYSTLTKKDIFDKATSEKVLALQDLFDYGAEVFNSLDKFNAWLDIPAKTFEGATGFSMLDTSFGQELVVGELRRLDYGLPV